MGAGLSDNGDKAPPPPDESFKTLFSAAKDPRSTIAAAFGEDAMPEIERIVKELEQTVNPHKEQDLRRQTRDAQALHKHFTALQELVLSGQQTEETQIQIQTVQELANNGNTAAAAFLTRLDEAIRNRRQQEHAARQNERVSSAAAENWLRSRMEQGARQREVEQEKKVSELTIKAAEDEARALKEMVRQTALAEMEAREALRTEASDVAQIRLEDAELASLRAKVKLEGLRAQVPPRRPSMSSCEEADTIPQAPNLSVKTKKASGPVPKFYAILEVSVDATFEEIKKGFRQQALKWHPDKNKGKEAEAAERFKNIMEAFDTLYDPQRRERYDAGQLPATQGKVKKLQGHGWAKLSDENEAALTPVGIRYKNSAWGSYVLLGGRIDDDENDLIMDESDPRLPQQKVRIFWRGMAERACYEKEKMLESEEENDWMMSFIKSVWKDTPSRWPKSAELQGMSEASQNEWKERRMVYHRRKEKLKIHMKMQEAYLAIPDRVKKEQARMKRLGLGVPAVFGRATP